MTISSKCPDKWLFVDLETTNIWHVREDAQCKKYPFWRVATRTEIQELIKAAKRELKYISE
jgi:hypothetical protein